MTSALRPATRPEQRVVPSPGPFASDGSGRLCDRARLLSPDDRWGQMGGLSHEDYYPQMQRAAQKSLAVMCPACSRSPEGLLALMESANRSLITRAGSMFQ